MLIRDVIKSFIKMYSVYCHGGVKKREHYHIKEAGIRE